MRRCCSTWFQVRIALTGVAHAAEDPVSGAVERPVGIELDVGERARPVREPKLPGALPGVHGANAAVRKIALPALQRPVRPVGRRARHHEVRKRRPVVWPQRVDEPHPDRTALGAAGHRCSRAGTDLRRRASGVSAPTAPHTSTCLVAPRA